MSMGRRLPPTTPVSFPAVPLAVRRRAVCALLTTVRLFTTVRLLTTALLLSTVLLIRRGARAMETLLSLALTRSATLTSRATINNPTVPSPKATVLPATSSNPTVLLPTGYTPHSRTFNETQGVGILCAGLKGSTVLPSRTSFHPHWFSPSLVHHGPGTQFGGPVSGKAEHACLTLYPTSTSLRSLWDQTFFQNGLACGTCVEIASTDASQFSNSAVWTVEPAKSGTLPAGKKTVAIVSDLAQASISAGPDWICTSMRGTR